MTPATERNLGVRLALAACLACAAVEAGCGKKGPPLAPLRLVPAAVAELSARRTAEEVRLQFTVPSTNANGPGRVDLDRIEIFAASVPAGAATPAAAELLEPRNRIGQVVVGRPADEAAGTPETDTRPGPGDAAAFVEKLGPGTVPPAPAAAAAATAPGAAPASTPPAPAYPVRAYVLRGVSTGGRPGAPSAVLAVPLVEPPAAPVDVTAAHTETALAVEWKPGGGAASAQLTFNVYRDRDAATPANPKPLTAPRYEEAGVTYGEEQCFVVRALAEVGGVAVEGLPSAPACLTPRDTFAPAAPRNLTVIASPGAMNLSWEANTEKDLAGYLVLRGEAGSATLQQLTQAAVRETTYTDDTVKPGVTYVYSIVAMDSATPPNVSAQSAQRTETAR